MTYLYSSPPPPSPSSTSTSTSLPDIFQKVENSVVQITSTKSNPNEIIIENGVPATGKSTALGSGFVYDNQGHIVTNYHVTNGARRTDVTFTDGNTYSAKVVAKDPNSDLTVLALLSSENMMVFNQSVMSNNILHLLPFNCFFL